MTRFIIITMFVLAAGTILAWNIGPFDKAIKGEEVASKSPFHAYVVKNYRDCTHAGLFSSGNKIQCKVSIAQLVRLEKGDSSVQDAMRVIEAYEHKKLKVFGI